MKNYLLDTHIFLWAFSKPERLGRKISRALQKDGSLFYLSAISLIEIAQLYETKPKEFDVRMPLGTFIGQALSKLRVSVLAIDKEHAQRYYEIQPLKDHNDPFDRTIIAQAAHTGFTVLSDDHNFPHYPIALISG